MAVNDEAPRGIELLESDWPKALPAESASRPIDHLKPGSKQHDHVLRYLVKRIEDSERVMSNFHERWQQSEQRYQAYLVLDPEDQKLKAQTDAGSPPKVVHIVVPYSFAVINTIVTFLLHTFTGRKPNFQVGTWKDESVGAARKMEIVLQYNSDHTRLVRYLWQSLQDSQIYGVSILRTGWERKEALRTVRTSKSLIDVFGRDTGQIQEAISRERRLVYEGNAVSSQDPFMFFPDPSVPMAEVSRRGEYVWFRNFDGRHVLKEMEADPNKNIAWVNAIGDNLPRNVSSWSNSDSGGSVRSLMAGGESTPGSNVRTGAMARRAVQLDHGTCKIIPRELGLGESTEIEMWIFTIANKSQIIQAEPYGHDHDMHPVAIAEPYSMGYGLGNLGISDYLGPLQDTMSWFINSHIDNVRKVLNDMLIVDPSMVEMADLDEAEPGKRIRLKPTAYGRDVRTAIQQLQIVDVTSNHINDLEIFFRIGQLLTAVNENILGSQDQGGRKSATEVRTTSEAAASRLAAQSRIISAQQMVDLTEQMSVNIQQFQSDDFYISVVGRSGLRTPLRLTSDQLAGDFFYPVNDGTVPLDRVALMDVWREVMGVVLQDPQLRQTYDIVQIFEFVAELGGAKNLQAMRIGVQDPATIDQGLQAGNLVPLNSGGGGLAPPRVDAGLGQQSDRAIQ